MPRLARPLFVLLCAVLILGSLAGTAEARGHGKRSHGVSGIVRAGQDWYHSRLKIAWRAVPGASYQMRYAYSPAKLSYARLIRTGTSGGTYSGVLDRGKPWYFQVRAVKSGVPGAWSQVRAISFVNLWPKIPVLSGVGVPGGASFKWGYTPYASRYRVRWSAAWYGQWPGAATYVSRTSGGWVNQYARSSTYAVPAHPAAGDNYLAVDYANPVFGQLEANDAYNPGASQRSKWVAQWPTPVTPAAGDPVRFGSYNVALYPVGSRAAVVATNIATHDLTMVALQEADAQTQRAVLAALPSSWRAAPSGNNAAQQILFRADLFTMRSGGTYSVPNPKAPSSPLLTPYATFSSVHGSASSQNFIVSSVHFSESAARTPVQKNADTGEAARAAMAGINAANPNNYPVIVAGDMRYGREPYGDPVGYTAAQPTFVRGGYYDAMASLSRTGSQYATVNSVNGTNTSSQSPHPSGLGPRADYILTKGFKGSFRYVNVYNWASGGVVPSDHNLIYADLAIPPG